MNNVDDMFILFYIYNHIIKPQLYNKKYLLVQEEDIQKYYQKNNTLSKYTLFDLYETQIHYLANLCIDENDLFLIIPYICYNKLLLKCIPFFIISKPELPRDKSRISIIKNSVLKSNIIKNTINYIIPYIFEFFHKYLYEQ